MIEKEELYSIVPHRGKMLFLTKIKEYNLEERTIEAEYFITEDCLFYDPIEAAVPAWVGFECIAQTISAFSGISDREKGEPPKIGFILSVSSVRIGIPFIKSGSTLEIKAKEIEHMDSVYVFEGEVLWEGKKVLKGKLTVFDADDEQTQALKEGK